MKILFATGNAGKVREAKMIFADLNCEIITLKDLNIELEVEENGSSFAENSLIKAKEFAKIVTDTIVIADDSGLVIDYLNGEPGIYSARYLGEDTSYERKNQTILQRMEQAKGDERSARFVCAITAVMPNGEMIQTQETMEGVIAREIAGVNGFGYDPIFYLPEYKKTSAEISAETKNDIAIEERHCKPCLRS